MNMLHLAEIQKHIEQLSNYAALLQDRYINESHYAKCLLAIKQGCKILGISDVPLRAFEGKKHFIIWLGRRLPEYQGQELAVYIGHKKMGLPVPEGLIEKCPRVITTFIQNARVRDHIQKFVSELKNRSLSPEIFLSVHHSLLSARTENLLPDLLADIERISCTGIQDAVSKIPKVYLNYLSQQSFLKILKKISTLIHDVKARMEQELKDIDLYSLRLKEQLNELYLEADKGLREIIENDVEKGVDIGTITQKTANLFSRLDRLFLGNIYHLKDYDRRRAEIQQALHQEEELRYHTEQKVPDKRKKTEEIYDEYIFFQKFGALTKDEERVFTKSLQHDFERLHRAKSPSASILQNFEKRGLLSVEIDFDSVLQAYHEFMKKTIIPNQIGLCLLDLVQCFPPAPDQPPRIVRDLAHLKTLALEGSVTLTLSEQEEACPKEIVKLADTYRKCVTILVYDIRGSSYMGVKLQNAAKEQRIKYKFAKEMADIVKRYGGFLLKDTGDGGLIWFAENSASLYSHLYTESITGRGIKLRSSIFSGAEFELIPAIDSAKRAVLCARDMVVRAEEFVRANFMHYREWFADVAERTLELDGITYALLPPEFKSLFRIGVGIASGIPTRDVVFSANSYGDPDLVGPIISDANLYSMERQPGRSVVICDFSTMINLILNAEGFEFASEESDFEKYLKHVHEMRKNIHGYLLPDYNVRIMPRGVHYMEELNKAKAVTSQEISEVLIHDDSFYDQKRKKLKIIYEVTNT